MLICCICTQYLVGAPFALITASIRRGMEVISLWHCWGGMEAQVSLTVAFRSSALLGLVSLMPSPAGKWNQHLHKACQQKEAWSALKCPGKWLRWLWTSENTVDQHQQMTWQPKSSLTVETSHWTSSNMDSVPLHSSSRLWDLVSKWNAKFTFIWKEDFGPLSNSPVLFLHSPGKTLLALSLVQKWLGSPYPEDVWAWWLLMHWLQLQSTPCEALPMNQLCLTVFSSLQSSLLLVHLFLPKFFLPVNFFTLFVEGVNVRLLDHCQVSSLLHYCGFKEQEIPGIYTAGMVINWKSNVNILIFWVTDFWLSWAVSSNHQN